MSAVAFEIIDLTDDPSVFQLDREDPTVSTPSDQTCKAMASRIRLLEQESRRWRLRCSLLVVVLLLELGACVWTAVR